MQTEEKFVVPTAEFVIFPKQDIVTTSGEGDMGGGIILPDVDWE